MIAADDPELVWTVTAREAGKVTPHVEVSVRHPRLDVVGWSLDADEAVARERALLRLNSMLRDPGGWNRP